jgi:membrane-associated phospholipid phosphatase
VSALDTASTVRTRGEDGWVRAWPLNKTALLVLAKGGVLLLAVWTGLGLLYMSLLDDGAVGDADRDLARWLEDHRTPTWDTLTDYGSMLSDTIVKVILVAVVGGAMVIVWRRWHDGVFLAVVVSLEAAVFVITSFIVDRDRPPVDQLDAIPPSGSFPSGHVGAAVAFYGGVFVITRWHTRNRVVRAVFGVIAVVAPLIVGASRAYRGMHHPIDVLAGLLLGVASILVVRAALAAGVEEIDRTADDAAPGRVRRLDLTGPDPVDGPIITLSGAQR